ncbi:MAG: diguanylate cyclase [Actinobacteria bacterium]|nr:diguanylate cyclase [Actinomycetota bacterium]
MTTRTRAGLNIYKKMAVIFAILACASIASIIIINIFVIQKNYKDLEEHLIVNEVLNIEETIGRQIDSLDKICKDWASWNDTYDFMEQKNRSYIDSNFADPLSTMENLNTSIIIFINREGEIVYSKYYNLEKGTEEKIPEEITSLIVPGGFFLDFSGSEGAEINKEKRGIIKTGDGIFILSASPILISSDEGPSKGTLVMVSNLEKIIGDMKLHTDTTVSLKSTDTGTGSNASFPEQLIMEGSTFPSVLIGETIVTYPDSKSYIAGKLIEDIFGNPSVLVGVEGERTIAAYGRRAASIEITTSIVFLFILVSAALWLIYFYFLKKISGLSKSVEKIGKEKDLAGRIAVVGNDEISSLQKSINLMLADIEKSQHEVSKTQKMYQDLFEQSIDGMYRSALDGQYLSVNNAMVKILGYSSKEELLRINTFDLYCNKNDRPDFNSRNKTFSSCLKRKDGIKIQVEISPRVVFENGKPLYYEGIVRDTTERKKYEERIKYISFHDKLTDLYNRAFFDEEIRRLKKTRNLPLTIIFSDVDNLKFINDNYGHEKGDALLIKASSILKECFRDEDIIARIGGDEFCIILPGTGKKDAESIVRRVQERCVQESTKTIPIRISFGIETKESQYKSLRQLLKDAENKMYMDKLRGDQF